MLLEIQDAVGDDGGDRHAHHQRQLEQERDAQCAAEELGQVGRHGRNLADAPHGIDRFPRKMIAGHFRQIAPGDNPELGGQRLKQHGDQVGHQHDPKQGVAELGAGLDVGREVSGIHVSDRGDDRGPR